MIDLPLLLAAIFTALSAIAFLARRSVQRRERAASKLGEGASPRFAALPDLRELWRKQVEVGLPRRLRIILILTIGLLVLALTGNVLLALLSWPIILLIERFSPVAGRGKTRVKMEEQVLELIDSLNQSLRSGLSLQQSLEVSMEDVGEEMRHEVLVVLQELRLGSGLETALTNAAEAAEAPSLRMTFTVLGLLHGKGGDLPRILERLRKRVAEGLEARRETRVLTSQSRASGYLVSALPLVFFLLQAALNPQSLRPLFSTTTGNLIMIAAAGMNAAAFLLIRKIVNPEV
jgi:tight adherence protein B